MRRSKLSFLKIRNSKFKKENSEFEIRSKNEIIKIYEIIELIKSMKSSKSSMSYNDDYDY